MSTPLPDLLRQDPLDVNTIADVQRIRSKTMPSSSIKLLNEHHHLGVLVMEISIMSAVAGEGKRAKIDSVKHRVVVIGQKSNDDGVVMFLNLGSGDRANVYAGLQFESSNIDTTHWCDGLAIKQVRGITAVGKRGQAAKRHLKDARKNQVKELLRLIDDDDNCQKEWTKLDWKAFDATVDKLQPSLKAKNTSATRTGGTKPAPGKLPSKPARRLVRTQEMEGVLPSFEPNKMGILDREEVQSANKLMRGFLYPFRNSETRCREETFADLMNKAYPHALFTKRIMTAYYLREDGERKYSSLEEVPEFREWWHKASLRPAAGKSPRLFKRLEEQANPKPKRTYPGYIGFCNWLVMKSKQRKQTSSSSQAYAGEGDVQPVPISDDVYMKDVSEDGELDYDMIAAIMGE